MGALTREDRIVTSPREAAPQSGAPNNASPLDLDGLRKLAEAAIPSPQFDVAENVRNLRALSLTFNPQTVLALLQHLTDAEAENASLRERLERTVELSDNEQDYVFATLLTARFDTQWWNDRCKELLPRFDPEVRRKRREADAAAPRPLETPPQSTERT
jgi:hypothetical protein